MLFRRHPLTSRFAQRDCTLRRRPLPIGSSYVIAVTKRFGRSVGEMRFSGRPSLSFSQESNSISFEWMKLNVSERPLDSRFCTRTLMLWKYELPTLLFCCSTPLLPVQPPAVSPTGNSGYRANTCAVLIAAPFWLVARPANGFGVVLVR